MPHPDPQSNKSKWLEVQKEGFYIEIKSKMTKIYIKEESIEGMQENQEGGEKKRD